MSDKAYAPHPDCCGLEIDKGQGSETEYPLLIELVFGWQDVHSQDVSFSFGVRRGVLRLDLRNCSVAWGTRSGLEKVPDDRTMQVNEVSSVESKRGNKRDARLSLDAIKSRADFSGGAGKNIEYNTNKKTEKSYSIVKNCRSIQGTRKRPSWYLECDEEDPVLSSSMVRPSEALCYINFDEKEHHVSARVTCLPLDFEVKNIEVRGFQIRSPNKEKLVKRLIAELPKNENGIILAKDIIREEG